MIRRGLERDEESAAKMLPRDLSKRTDSSAHKVHQPTS